MTMRTVVLLLFLIITNLQLYGFYKKLSIGIDAGPSIVYLRGSEQLKELNSDLRWSAGIVLKYQLNNGFYIKSGINYERKGASQPNMIVVLDSMGNTSGEVTDHLYYNYLTVPFLLQYTFGRKIKFFGDAGCYIGYLINRKDIAKGENTNPIVLSNTKQYDKPMDFGASFGIGTLLPIKKGIFFSFEITDNVGLYNTHKVEQNDLNLIETRTINFLLGIEYHL